MKPSSMRIPGTEFKAFSTDVEYWGVERWLPIGSLWDFSVVAIVEEL